MILYGLEATVQGIANSTQRADGKIMVMPNRSPLAADYSITRLADLASATGMDLGDLKRESGKDLVFWGGGVDTKQVLGAASPEEIRKHVRGNIESLAPRGRFVFAAVRDIQANVPPENIMAMWEAWREYGSY